MFTGLLSLVALAIYFVPGATGALEFSRQALSRGEIWRLLTGHFTHFEGDHLSIDLVVFAVFGSFGEIRNRNYFLFTLAFASLAISASVWWFQPQFQFYRGLSGLDSALAGMIFARELREAWRRKDRGVVAICAVASLGFCAKSIYELGSGKLIFVANETFAPMPMAHVVGFVTAWIVCAVGSIEMLRPATAPQQNEGP